MQPFTKRLVELLPNQFHSKAVQTDAFLRVDGAPRGTVYAIGDASTVRLLHLTWKSQLMSVLGQHELGQQLDGALGQIRRE